jgi:3-deoxy-D-manno-octulosonic-acid transferase
MSQSTLSKKQLSLIDDIFAGDIDTEAILAKHKITHRLFNKWLGDENFRAEFTRRIDWLNLQSQVMIARYTSLAAAKLVSLTDSQNQETKRKACLDIISLPRLTDQKQNMSPDNNIEPAETLHPDTASILLKALAQQKNNNGNA